MHLRLQTYLPFDVQVCLNGREWLARQLVCRGVGFEQADNCFTRVDDPEDFCVLRPRREDERGERLDATAGAQLVWRNMRKSVADLHRRAALSQRANERYLDALSVVDDTTPCSRIFDTVANPCVTLAGAFAPCVWAILANLHYSKPSPVVASSSPPASAIVTCGVCSMRGPTPRPTIAEAPAASSGCCVSCEHTASSVSEGGRGGGSCAALHLPQPLVQRRSGTRRYAMSEPLLLIEKSAGIATLTLNRPDAMNALSRALRGALVEAFASLRDDGETGVVILTGAGRAFCAGLDLKELGGATAADNEEAVAGADVVGALQRFDRPIIGAINGFAITGGFELALACDILIASSAARFADTHARVGIMPGWGLSQKLSRSIGIYRAKELSLTGNYLSATQAEAWGLVNRVVAPEALLPACRTLATDILSCVPDVMRAYKRVIDDGYAQSFAEGLRLEAQASRAHARSVTPETIAARRAGVQARGREQKG